MIRCAINAQEPGVQVARPVQPALFNWEGPPPVSPHVLLSTTLQETPVSRATRFAINALAQAARIVWPAMAWLSS